MNNEGKRSWSSRLGDTVSAHLTTPKEESQRQLAEPPLTEAERRLLEFSEAAQHRQHEAWWYRPTDRRGTGTPRASSAFRSFATSARSVLAR